MRRIFVDTEWTAVPWSEHCDLLWVGLADPAGANFCALSSSPRVDASNERYVADLLALITPDVPRLGREELSRKIREFCGDEVEFWAWIPTLESFAAWSGLGSEAAAVYERCRDIDLQMLRSLVKPWPMYWPSTLHDLNAAAAARGVSLPAREPNHLHPRVHSHWNQQLFARIEAASRAP